MISLPAWYLSNFAPGKPVSRTCLTGCARYCRKHARDGCLSVTVTRNQDDPAAFAFIEQWDSRQHYARYFAWREMKGVLDELAAMIEGEASFRFFDYVGL